MRRTALASILLAAGCSSPRPPAPATPPAPAAASPLAAGPIDRLIEQTWREAKVTPAPIAGDGEYLRRVSLDLVGRLPKLAETKAFLADGAADKRARLVDRLLSSPEMAEHWADVYSDLLFGTDAAAEKLEKQWDPRAHLVRAFQENRPWDRLVWELLTATGDLRDSGAVAFIAARGRGGGGPEAVTGAAARLFLGLQIQCAQCHDHPYDPRWKQEDFYGLVAFFARTKARGEKVDGAEMMMAASMAEPGKKNKQPRTYVLVDVKRGEAKMRRPRSEVEERVAPRFLGRQVAMRPDESRRAAFARAVITSDLFPKVMVARTWAQLFGRGLVDPWDDLGAENDPKHPPLLVHLARGFAASGFDVKALLRALVLSTAYQRSSAGADDAALRAFARHGIRPLAPEVLVRSLLTATGLEAAARRRGDDARLTKRLGQAFREYRFVFGDDEMREVERFDGSVPQSLLLWNGELTNLGARAEPGGTLGAVLADRRDPAGRLEDLFLAVYSRPPTDGERAALLPAVRSGGRAAWEDLFFALLTSTEAITNH